MIFLIDNLWLILLISSSFLSLFFVNHIAQILLIPFKVVWFVLKLIIKFFKWLFGLFKKPTKALKRANRLERT